MMTKKGRQCFGRKNRVTPILVTPLDWANQPSWPRASGQSQFK